MSVRRSETSAPIRFGIRFPTRISVERTADLAAFGDVIALNFHGADGSRLTVVLSQEQAEALVSGGVTDPTKVLRDLYVAGHIEADEFERRLEDQ